LWNLTLFAKFPGGMSPFPLLHLLFLGGPQLF